MRYVELAASIFECIIITESTTKCLGYRNDRYICFKFTAYLTALIFINLFLPYLTNSDIVPGVCQILVTVAFGIMFLQGTIFTKLFIAVLSNIGLLIVNISVMGIFSCLTRMNFNALIVNQTMTRVLLLFVTKFVYFLFTRLMLKFFGKDKYPLSIKDWYIIISLLVISLLSGLVVFGINLHEEFNPALIVIATGLIAAVNTAVYIILSLQVRFNLASSQIKTYENYQIAKEIEIKEITEKNDKIRKIKHELKNTGLQIQSLINEGKLEDAEKMISEITNIKLGEDNQYIKLKHNMLSAIINNKLTVCSRENIQINMCDAADIEADLYGVSETDMCTIIGNLLDNAIEACRKLKTNKNVGLKISQSKGYIIINIKNTTRDTKINYNGYTLKTSKKDKSNHGLGTQIINELANKYNGSVKYKIENNQFTANVILQCVVRN